MQKTFLFLLFLALVAVTPAKAVLVTIPDANFRARLQTLYPACFVSGQMETTCAGITSATLLDVNSLNIANLSGLEYFTSLLQLRCFNNQLTVLPTLPASLQILECDNNQLTVLPTLPASITELYCNNNQLNFADLEAISPRPTFYLANPQNYKILPATQSLASGTTLTINGTIGGTLNVYKWYRNSVLIPGATGATFTIPSVATTDAGTYKCEVTSTFVGTGTTTGIIIKSSNVVVTVLACPTVTITTLSLSNAIIGIGYSQTLTQTGLTGTPTWSSVAGSLPNNIAITAGGIISGTPSTSGTFNFTIQVTNGTCTQTKVFSIVVACPTTIITPVAPTQPITYTVGTSIPTITLSATGVATGTYAYSVTAGALPAGVTLSGNVIGGTPTTSSSSTSFTITATSGLGACTGTATYSYSVVCPTAVFTNMVGVNTLVLRLINNSTKDIRGLCPHKPQ